MQSLNFEILQTKVNVSLGKQEDFHESQSNRNFEIPCTPKFTGKLALLFMF